MNLDTTNKLTQHSPEIDEQNNPDVDLNRTAPNRTSPTLTALAHGARDLGWQAAARAAGLAVFSATARMTSHQLPLQLIAGGLGALSAASQAYLIASHHIGTETPTQMFATGFCTAGAAVAGASVAVLGMTQPIVVIVAGSTFAIAPSLMRLWATSPDEDKSVDQYKGIAFIAGTAASLMAVAKIGTHHHVPDIVARNLGVAVESVIVELGKSSFERVGPSMNRSQLNFNEKVRSSFYGVLPYAAATVLLNGYVSGLLQPPNDSTAFDKLILPLMIGAIANGVRGISNAMAVYTVHKQRNGQNEDAASIIRPSQGPTRPDLSVVGKKSAVRFFMSSCRNAIYVQLRKGGMSVLQATILAQFAYAFFAQNRDLVYDLMQGEGWTAPTIKSRGPMVV
jgi:hypothetical protein